MKTLMDTLYIAWIIGTKDILDALKNKNSRSNIMIMIVHGGVFLLVRRAAPLR